MVDPISAVTLFALLIFLPIAAVIAFIAGLGSWLLRNVLSHKTALIWILVLNLHLIIGACWIISTNENLASNEFLIFAILGQIVGSFLGWRRKKISDQLSRLPDMGKLLLAGLVITPYLLIFYVPIITQTLIK